MSTFEKIEKINDKIQDLYREDLIIWTNEVLFTWRWWFGVIISILAWLFWVKFHKKKSRYLLLLSGFFVMIVSLSLDAMGIQLGFWSYKFKVTPFIPAYLPYDLALMPVVVMGLIQYKPNISPYIKGLIFAVLAAFVAEPMITLLDIYEEENWKYFYSVPIYFVIYIIAHFLSTRKEFDSIKG